MADAKLNTLIAVYVCAFADIDDPDGRLGTVTRDECALDSSPVMLDEVVTKAVGRASQASVMATYWGWYTLCTRQFDAEIARHTVPPGLVGV